MIGLFFGDNKLPLEKATLANLAVDTATFTFSAKINFSINNLLAPIMFTGVAALSGDTQKYFLVPIPLARPSVLIVLKILTPPSKVNRSP